MHCTTRGGAIYIDCGVNSVSWSSVDWWPWMWKNDLGKEYRVRKKVSFRTKFWVTWTFKGQAERKELLRESEEKQWRAGRKTRRGMSVKPKEERVRGRSGHRVNCCWEICKMRFGHMVISGLGGFRKSCFGAVIRLEWNGLRSEWEMKKCTQLMCLMMWHLKSVLTQPCRMNPTLGWFSSERTLIWDVGPRSD